MPLATNELDEMSFEIPGVLWRRDPQAAEAPLVFELAAQRVGVSRGFSLLLLARRLADGRGRLCRRALRGRTGIGRDPDRRGISAQLSRSQPGGRRSRHRHTRRRLAEPLAPLTGTRVGLVRRVARPGIPIYDRKLTAAEVMARVERCHTPYHRVLEEACDRLHRKFGVVWHVNCHSMPSQRSGKKGGRLRGFCVGRSRRHDLRPGIHRFCRRRLRGRGYTCASTKFTKGSKSSSGKAVRRPTGTACRSRSTAHSIWTRRRWKRLPALTDCRPTSPF